VRAALGVRTIFNLLGPLANPAQAPYAVIGAWNLEIARLMAETLAGMPIARMFVVHGDGDWDEPTPAASFTLFDVRPGSVAALRRSAQDFGLPVCRLEELVGGDVAYNARRLGAVLRGQERGGHRDALVMGAALVAEVTGTVPDARAGVVLAVAAIDDGRAARLLDDLTVDAGLCTA
jgi:anthranilate phosphoribosyltransferase